MAEKKSFSGRSFVTQFVVFTFVIITVSGIILYFAPPGRVANWSYWTFLFLSKGQWQSLHTLFSFIFVVMGAIHLYNNWKTFMHYLRRKVQEGIKIKKEFSYVFVIVIAVSALTIMEIPPFSSVYALGEEFSEGWSSEESEPPVPHAELLTPSEFAAVINISTKQLLGRLEKANITVSDTTMTIAEIAAENNKIPQEIYAIAMGTSEESSGYGYGIKTVEQICDDAGVPVEDAVALLKEKGLEVEGSSKIKDLALELELTPFDIVEMITSVKPDTTK